MSVMASRAMEVPSLASASGPVEQSSRLMGLDLARGIALLGITFVNIELFAEPFESLMDPSLPPGQSLAGQAFYWFTMVFCTSKFYPLFSLLFGIGLAMVYASTARAGRSFGWVLARRLLVLAGFGIGHILLVWHGDVLLLYAMVGALMLLLARLSARGLYIAAGVFFSIGMLGAVGFGLLGMAGGGGSSGAGEIPPMPEAPTLLQQFGLVLRNYQPGPKGIDPRITILETQISQQGPFVAAMAVRAFNYAFSLGFMLLIMIWQVAACFCLGAALVKNGFVNGGKPEWRRWFVRLGLLVGLPMQVIAAWAAQDSASGGRMLVSLVGNQLGGPLVSLMYLSLALNLAESGRAAGLVKTVARLGQMGLTGYLGVSVLMQAMMQHWGLAWFGQVDFGTRWLLVIGVWLVVLGFANVWMRAFHFGPMEWVWRTLTYLRWQPIWR
jgi:uncharacterized protein